MTYSLFVPRTYVLALLALVYGAWAAVLPARNTTITLPPGVTYDPGTNVWCTPTTWTDIGSFFLGNYLSHAATVISFPGEPVSITIMNMILAIFFPSLGAGRGVLAMVQHAAFYKDPIQQALRSRALCMVVRSQEWKPMAGETLRSMSFLSKKLRDDNDEYEAYKIMSKNTEKVQQYVEELKAHHEPIELKVESPPWLQVNANSTRVEIVGRHYQVFGTYKLPEGYELAYVPANGMVESVSFSSDSSDQITAPKSEFALTSAYSFASALISIIQIIYALTGLYRSRGNQVSEYGYAAFSFTVLPYVIMSFVNLLGNLVTPRYPTLYLVRSEMMDEASRRGGEFQGVVGHLESAHLEVEDTFVFSAALKESAQDRWEFQLGEKIYLPSEVEPMTAEKHELVSNPDEDIETGPHDAKASLSADEKDLKPPTQSSDTHEIDEKRKRKKKKSEEDKKPLLICPNCYYFKTTKASDSNFLSIANPKQFHFVGAWLILIVRILVGSLPLAVIGGMSQFKTGSSTVAQRAWTMSWLAVGMALPIQPFWSYVVVHEFTAFFKKTRNVTRKGADARVRELFWDSFLEITIYILFLVLCGAPAIGGFVVVAQMLRESASCEVI